MAGGVENSQPFASFGWIESKVAGNTPTNNGYVDEPKHLSVWGSKFGFFPERHFTNGVNGHL